MTFDALLTVLSRWVHVTTACVVLGGVFFLWVILPRATAALDEAQRLGVTLQARRAFKMVVHTAILLFIVTGTYNTIVNWSAYRLAVPMSHAMLGMHLLLGLAIFAISIVLMMGKEPPKRHRTLLAVNLVLLVLTVAAASSLKYVRDHAPRPAEASATR
jgi:uncharacterized membrane protein